MKSKRIYPAFTISKKGEMSLKNGHPWVYCDELRNEPEGLKNGELCDVFSEKGSYLGTGFLSLNSKIRIRILSDNANENFSENFFRRRIRYAIDYRKTVMGDDFSACRLIFGEADGGAYYRQVWRYTCFAGAFLRHGYDKGYDIQASC